MKVLYTAGRYSGEIDINIQKAREIAIKLWEMGYAVVCPHLNSAHMERDCKAKYEDFLAGDFEIIERCNAVIMIPGWQNSNGACKEKLHAEKMGIPVYEYPDLPERI